jgi:hypothetical protein
VRIWGNDVGCPYTDSNTVAIQDKIRLVESETNLAIQGNGGNPIIHVVLIHILSEDSPDFTPNLDYLYQVYADPAIAQLQDDSGADLVAVIGGSNAENCALANNFGQQSITSYDCLGGYFFSRRWIQG